MDRLYIITYIHTYIHTYLYSFRSWLKHGPVVSNGRTFDDIILEDSDVRTIHTYSTYIHTYIQYIRTYIHVESTPYGFYYQVQAAIHGRDGGGSGQVARRYRITNTDRTAFARISGVLAKKYGDGGFPGLLQVDLTGAAGQSFCAFLSAGMEITLEGYANDYVGKGMYVGDKRYIRTRTTMITLSLPYSLLTSKIKMK